MSVSVISKIMFTVTFPNPDRHIIHAPSSKLHSLAKKQLTDLEIIETIEHLLKCQRCFETYRSIRLAYQTL